MLVPCGPEKSQALLVHELKARAHNLRHRFQSTKDLGSGILVLKHDGCGTIVGRDFADHCEFVRGVLLQGIRLKTEQRRKCEEQHHARDQYDHESDFLPDRSIAQVSHGSVNSGL